MNLYIYPRNYEEAVKSGWIVRFLHFLGVVQVILGVILGVAVGGPFFATWLVTMDIMTENSASIAALFLGVAVGIFAGLFSGLVFFALSQVIDDLHAIRVHTAGYISVDADSIRPGERQ